MNPLGTKPAAVRHSRPDFDIIQTLSIGKGCAKVVRHVASRCAVSQCHLRHFQGKTEECFGKDEIMKLMKLMLSFIAALALTACNTVQGVGKDIQAGGKAVEKVAK
jgi:predicted small secreted protein